MYLGRSPAIGTQKVLDSLESQFNGTLTTFDLRYNGEPTYPALSSSLIVSLGGVLQEPGEAYYVSSDTIVFATAPPAGSDCWILLYSEYGAAAGSGSSGGAVSVATGEPMGYEERTDSAISFDNATRTFTIEPASGISEFVVWTKGTKRTYSSAQTVQIGTATGLYYIYFDAFGVLQYRTTYFDWDDDTPTAYVYWNATTATGVFVADERHGIVLDWQTHEYLHRTRGAVIANGFSISNYTTSGDGSADADAQFDLGNGTFFDEDLEVGITHSATPSAGTFTQVLTGNAEIPVYYMSGSEGDWVRDTATEFACKQSGTTLQYNSLSGSTWSTTAANDNRYVVSWVVATNEISAPVIAILGQDQYSSIGTAEEAVWGDLTLTNFPIFEFRPLWKIIFRTNSTFTNTPNAYIANVLDLREFSSIGIAGTIVNDHGLLSGLADDDHAQYLHASVDRTGVTANISTTGNITAANLIATGQLQGPANFVIDPAAVGDDTGNVEIKGNLTVQGTTTTINSTTVDLDHLSLGDGEIANFGTGNDLRIYHSGNVSRIYDSSTNLQIAGSIVELRNSGTNEVMLAAYEDNRVELYYDDSKKFETTSTGAKVSGTLHIFENQATLLTLERNGAANAGIRYENDTSQMFAGLSSNANFFGIGPSENIAASTTQLVVMRTTGNVGIGTTDPISKLEVVGDITITNGTQNNAIRTNSDGQLQFLRNAPTNNTVAVTIDDETGYVGIGTDSPVNLLQLKTGDFTLDNNTYIGFNIYNDGSWKQVGSGNGAVLKHHVTHGFQIYTGADSGNGAGGAANIGAKFTVADTGNVGVGVNGPDRKLHVEGDIKAQGGAIILNEADSGNIDHIWSDDTSEFGTAGSFIFSHDTTYKSTASLSNVKVGHVYVDNGNLGTSAGSTQDLARFYANNGNATSIRLQAKRKVAGTSWTSASYKIFCHTDATEQGYIEFNPQTTVVGDGNYDVAIGSINGEIARFIAEGNVGIGTVSTTKKLHVAQASTDTYGTGVAKFTYTDTDSTPDSDEAGTPSLRFDAEFKPGHSYFKSFVTSNSTDFLIVDRDNSSARAAFAVEGAGGSNKVLYAMSNGNVGIGTATPAYKLEVEGDIKVGELGTLWFSDVSGSVEKITSGGGDLSIYSDADVHFFESDSNVRKFTVDVNNGQLDLGSNLDTTTAQVHFDYHTNSWINGSNVGIGTTDPEARLHVENAIDHSSTDYLNSDALIHVHNTSATGRSTIKLEGEATFTYGGGGNTLRIRDRQNLRAVIGSSGNVGIGTNNPTAKLHVHDGDILTTEDRFVVANRIRTNNGQELGLFAGESYGYIGQIGPYPPDFGGETVNAVAESGFVVYSSSANWIGTGAVLRTGTFCDSSGNGSLPGTLSEGSDARLKTNIQTIPNALNKVKSLRGAIFNRVDKDNKEEIGLIAQEVEEVLPQVVEESDYTWEGEKMKSIGYGKMAGLLIEAIKEQQAMINELREEINKLKNS